ncbi:hypothetical protein [Nonomuraea zeae]|uniref:Uncharacterized protein n=1 Tax=Nonomuraea zeae TaxID=1642303 RepID=A0A5S4FX32_9ACTN|nr:hypothetical protein [Nonomuraea zeae]TMR25246.1 hypothetical protein ETD85_45535 [Nonomuraea zeae]
MIDTPAEEQADTDGLLAGRQLDALRTTYPAWEIQHLAEGPGPARWTARLRRPVTAQLLAAGVRERVGGPDAITLASALAHQSALLHNRRPGLWPT